MKLRIAMFVLLGIFAITLSIHDAYAQTEEESNDKNRDYLSYENDEIGVTLEYPSDWKLMEDIPDVPFVARFWAPGGTGLISIDHVYQDTKIFPEEIAESHVKRMENRGDFLTSIESKSLLISEYPAWQLTYSGITHELRPYTFSKVFITTDNSRYTFSYDGGQYEEYLAIFNSIVGSVQIIPVDMKDSPVSSYQTFFTDIPDWVEYNVRWWNDCQSWCVLLG